MEYGKLLNSLPDTLKSKYRNYESLIKKYINAEWSKLFNSVCLKENLWPSYTNFKYICLFLHISTHLTQKFALNEIKISS